MIYDIKEFLKNCIKSRVFVLFVAMAVVFAIMLGRVFSLQIINGENYQKNFTQLIEKTVPIEATRGNIYDCNGKLLAYNQLAYSVVVTDAYANTSNRNEDLNKELAEIIGVIRGNDEEIYNNFEITLNASGDYEFNVTGTALKRFLADVFGQTSYDKLEYNKRLGFDEAKATKGMPTAIIMKTVKGKGVSYMENAVGWHGKAPNDEQYAQAMEDLEKVGEALCQK